MLSCQGESVKRKFFGPTAREDLAETEEQRFVLKLGKTSLRTRAFLVAMRPGATPVPIPNTMVKTRTADGTALETVWESRWPPNLKKKKDVVSDKETSEI